MPSRNSQRGITVDQHDGYWRGKFLAMASPCEVLCETDNQDGAEQLTKLVATEAWRIEDKFSRYLPGSIVNRINEANGKPVEVDAETAQLIDFSVSLYDLSHGRFDITLGALRRVWTFDGSSNIPSKSSVKKATQHIGWNRVRWNAPVLKMRPGMEIDFGGIGKEYAVDRAANLLRNATPLGCLINFGGDLVAVRKPCTRDAWKVGVEAVDASKPAGEKRLNLRVGALATSGDARRFLFKSGIRYSHILDSLTGWPVPDAPRSITVAADTCTQAGMLSTLAMLEGAGAEQFLKAQAVRYWCNRGNDAVGN